MDLVKYTEEMSKSIWDKAFFMDKIGNAKLVVDFGCADGALIRELGKLFPNTTFYGYDIDDELIDMAHQRNDTYSENVSFFHWSSLKLMLSLILSQYSPDEICVNFSCVLHEVYSQANTYGEKCFDDLKLIIDTLQPKYITIRDMYFFNYDHRAATVPESLLAAITSKVDSEKLEDFCASYGPICKWRSLTHFLMKYQWKDNDWDKEMAEDYYAWNLGNFVARVESVVAQRSYDVIFENHYQLPYLLNKWEDEYGMFNPDACTHIQAILRRTT